MGLYLGMIKISGVSIINTIIDIPEDTLVDYRAAVVALGTTSDISKKEDILADYSAALTALGVS